MADFEAAHAWYERPFGRPLRAIRDPDGNTITFMGNFRIDYRVSLAPDRS